MLRVTVGTLRPSPATGKCVGIEIFSMTPDCRACFRPPSSARQRRFENGNNRTSLTKPLTASESKRIVCCGCGTKVTTPPDFAAITSAPVPAPTSRGFSTQRPVIFSWRTSIESDGGIGLWNVMKLRYAHPSAYYYCKQIVEPPPPDANREIKLTPLLTGQACCPVPIAQEGRSPMNYVSDQELDDIERRASAATPGPWKSFIEGRDHTSGDSFIRTCSNDIHLTGATASDQDFIANSRQDIPRLIAAVRAMREAARFTT
jgi:hypothetical protein